MQPCPRQCILMQLAPVQVTTDASNMATAAPHHYMQCMCRRAVRVCTLVRFIYHCSALLLFPSFSESSFSIDMSIEAVNKSFCSVLFHLKVSYSMIHIHKVRCRSETFTLHSQKFNPGSVLNSMWNQDVCGC